jgi:hypothetical protein
LETKDLTKELKELQERDGRATNRTNERSIQKRTNEHSTKERTSTTPSVLHNFKKGQTVEIANTYGNIKGTRGVINYTTRTTVSFVDEAGTLHTRKYSNVKLVQEE